MTQREDAGGMTKVERSRIALLVGGVAFAVLRTTCVAAGAGPGGLPEVTVYKSPTCGCCTEWVAHLRRHGFPVKTEDVAELQSDQGAARRAG